MHDRHQAMSDYDRITTYTLSATDVVLTMYVGTELTLAFDDGSGNTIAIEIPVSEFQKLVDVFLEMRITASSPAS